MSDYRNDDHLDRVPPKTVQTERSGSSIFLIVAAVIALLAILWFAFAGGDGTTTAPAPGAVEQTAPMTPETGATTTPAVPETTVTPEPGTSGSTTTTP